MTAYPGTELEAFARAVTWKRYCRSHLAPFLVGDVLEVGAGLGGTTRVLCDGSQRSWTSTEPDRRLAECLRDATRTLARPPEIVVGTVTDLGAHRTFDAILYSDVLEHIVDDRAELGRAAAHLRPGGHLVVLAPAHNFLYTPFDRSIGHQRRYSRDRLRRRTPAGFVLRQLYFLDSVGLLLSLFNRLVVRNPMPTPAQVLFWDRVLVRCSRLLDPLLAWRVGKTIVGVWQKPETVPTH
jgi:SAM-dependent methyltransferase